MNVNAQRPSHPSNTDAPQKESDVRGQIVQILSNTANGCLNELGYYPGIVAKLHQAESTVAQLRDHNIQLWHDNRKLAQLLTAQNDRSVHTGSSPQDQHNLAMLRQEVELLKSERDNLALLVTALQKDGAREPSEVLKQYGILEHQHHMVLRELARLQGEMARLTSNPSYAHRPVDARKPHRPSSVSEQQRSLSHPIAAPVPKPQQRRASDGNMYQQQRSSNGPLPQSYYGVNHVSQQKSYPGINPMHPSAIHANPNLAQEQPMYQERPSGSSWFDRGALQSEAHGMSTNQQPISRDQFVPLNQIHYHSAPGQSRPVPLSINTHVSSVSVMSPPLAQTPSRTSRGPSQHNSYPVTPSTPSMSTNLNSNGEWFSAGNQLPTPASSVQSIEGHGQAGMHMSPLDRRRRSLAEVIDLTDADADDREMKRPRLQEEDRKPTAPAGFAPPVNEVPELDQSQLMQVDSGPSLEEEDEYQSISECIDVIFDDEDEGENPTVRGRTCVLCRVRYETGLTTDPPSPFIQAKLDELIEHCKVEHPVVWQRMVQDFGTEDQ